MDEFLKTLCIVAIIMVPIAFVGGIGAVLVDIGRSQVQQEAVDAGAAEWTVDANGVKGFRWKGKQ